MSGPWPPQAATSRRRDFALALGPFQTATGSVPARRRVRVTVAVERGSASSARSFLSDASVRNRIGEPMSFWAAHDFETKRLGLYVQSAQALASLGSTSGVNCVLRGFVVRNAYRTASPADLLTALRPFFPDTEQKLVARGARF
jgi:hypothetical protein